MPVVDMHSHFFPALTQQQSRLLSTDNGPWLKNLSNGKGMIMMGERNFRPVYAALWDPSTRLHELDAAGVDMQIICATPVLFGTGVEADKANQWAQMINDAALEMCAYAPKRLKTLCQVPLQDIDLACREADRACENGHIGVQIGNHVGDKNLDDEGLVRFLTHCAEQSIPVLVHPWDIMARERMPRYMLQWLVGMPAETHLSILSLILSGAFERIPKSLKLCFAHGGGNFALQIGRVDNAWKHRDIVRQDCPNLPSSYTNRFYVDSVIFSDKSLKLLVDVMGEDRILMGSDYPFPLGEQKPGESVYEATSISKQTRKRILGRNTLDFFGIEFQK